MANVPENIAGNVSCALWRIILKYILWYSCFSHFTVGSSKTRQITIRWLGLNTTNHDMRPIVISADEHIPAGAENPWTTWKAHNRLRTQVGRPRVNMLKWGVSNEQEICDCGIRQTVQHLLVWPMMDTACSPQDLTMANGIAIGCARHWEVTFWPKYDSWWKDNNDDESG